MIEALYIIGYFLIAFITHTGLLIYEKKKGYSTHFPSDLVGFSLLWALVIPLMLIFEIFKYTGKFSKLIANKICEKPKPPVYEDWLEEEFRRLGK